jgi:predicted dithiol-disulfide oxidoreductase (DUF899 family)
LHVNDPRAQSGFPLEPRKEIIMAQPREVVTSEQWIEARTRLLIKEKAFTRLRDELSAERRALPWEPVAKQYGFEGSGGRRTLPELFDGRGQLVVYHFMFGPDWEAGCPHCSRWADSFNGAIVHLNQRDVTMVAVSRAPYRMLAEYRKRMGWTFAWFSSFGSDFNFDYHVSFTAEEIGSRRAFYNFTMQDPGASEREGVSVFCKNASGDVFHSYSTYARGIDMLCVDYQYLDLVPKGRDEDGRGPYWVRRHDEYGA